MNSLYRPGNSLIHRISAGWKLISLAALLLALANFGRTPLGAGVSVLALLSLWLLAGYSIKELAKQVWKLKLLIVIVLVPQLIFNGLEQGSYNTVSVIVGVVLAGLVSLTTKTSEIVLLLTRITRSPSFALLIALSINSVALVTGFAKNISEAGKARGVKLKPARQLITLFVVSLRYADDYAEALAARGVRV